MLGVPTRRRDVVLAPSNTFDTFRNRWDKDGSRQHCIVVLRTVSEKPYTIPALTQFPTVIARTHASRMWCACAIRHRSDETKYGQQKNDRLRVGRARHTSSSATGHSATSTAHHFK